MSDLVTWLRAQLDEDERVAQAALDLDREVYPPPRFSVRYEWARHTRHASGGWGVGYAAGAPSPAPVLRQVDAMRAIVRLHQPEPGQHPDFCGHDLREMPCPTLRALALPYADRPGYRDEWRP